MSKQRVLILCTGNSARSQMAEGFLRHVAGDRFEVFSAGIKPSGLNLNAVKAMAEIGIDMANHRSKSVDEFIGRQFDYIITVCDNAKNPARFSPAVVLVFIKALQIRPPRPKDNNPRYSEKCATRFRAG